MPQANDSCPCGSGKAFGACCGAVLSGERQPASAEELMRARFTAHAVKDFAFLHRTYRGTAAQPYVAPRPEELPETEWTRLEVHSHTTGPGPDVAQVDFSAYGREKGQDVVLHEKAEFSLQNGAWIYTRPLREGPAPIKAAPKVGRNDPCPCGSGKKYKHCCGA